jgi:hypothetical protein
LNADTFLAMQNAFAEDAKAGRDEVAAHYVPILLFNSTVHRIPGINYETWTASPEDTARIIQAERAVSLLDLVPQIPEVAEGEEKPNGMPLTCGILWEAIAAASVCSVADESYKFARALYKKRRLSEKEASLLRTVLTESFTRPGAYAPSFARNLRFVTPQSEPLVVRAYMRAAASRTPDEDVINLFKRC